MDKVIKPLMSSPGALAANASHPDTVKMTLALSIACRAVLKVNKNPAII